MSKPSTISANLDRLQRFFTRAGEAGYVFAVASDEGMIPEVNQSLQDRVRKQNKTLTILELDPEGEASLIQQLQAAAKSATGLIVTGISTWLNRKGSEGLLALNFSREALHALGFPLLIWIDAIHLSQLTRQAADLHSRRRMATLFFEKPLDTLAVQQKTDTRFNPAFKSSAEYQRLQYRLALLQVQYEEAAEREHPRLLADYLLPLAKAYSELDLHQAALQLVDPILASALEQEAPELLVELGDILYGAKNYSSAQQAYEAALAQWPESAPKRLSYLLVQLGDLHQELGQLELAKGYFERDLTLNQKRSEEDASVYDSNRLAIAYGRLGAIYQAQGKFEQALEFFINYNQLKEELFQANPH
ncbi:MAG: hypothetical protein AAF804_07645, partial [Bacteroidota bacterium]